MRHLSLFIASLLLAACPADEEEPEPDVGGGSLDMFVAQPDAPPPREWTIVRVDDDTPTGQGLPLDAVEVCNAVGMGCVALEVDSASDAALDYAGAQDGANSQDDTCTDTTFTRLGGSGSFVHLVLPDRAALDKGAQINVWTATSDCPLIEAGDKNFTVSVGDAEGFEPVESCAGTCTVTVP